MSQTPRKLTIDLGFNFGALAFGTPVGRTQTGSELCYPLQMGIVDDNTGEAVLPYWLQTGDRVRFKVTDITHSVMATPADVESAPTYTPPPASPIRYPMQVVVAFVNPDSIASADQTVPLDPVPAIYQPGLSDEAGGLVFEGKTNLHWESEVDDSVVYTRETPNWEVNVWHCKLDEHNVYVELTDASIFVKCSFLVSVTQNGNSGTKSRDYILDPEWILGPHGG